jgi:hypothetical protein
MNHFTLEQSLGLISCAAAAWLVVRLGVANDQIALLRVAALRGVRAATHEGRMPVYPGRALVTCP